MNCAGAYSLDSSTLAIDIGTTHIKSMLVNSEGRPIVNSLTSRLTPLITDSSGKSVMEPDELLKQVARCVKETLKYVSNESYHVTSVGVCSFWHSCMGLDGQGNIVFPIITWGDTRAEAVAAGLKSEWSHSEIHRRTGCPIHSSYYPARLIWLRETYPDAFRQVHMWLSPADYLIFKLLGHCVTSHSMASATGLYDQDGMCWDENMLELCGITSESLPMISDEPIHTESKIMFRSTSFEGLSEALWCPGIGDGAASNIGCGSVRMGEAAINIGTSGAIRTVWRGENYPATAELWRYRLNASTPLYGAAFSDGGADILWAEKTLRLPKDVDTRMIAENSMAKRGLIFAPYLSGERSPHWRSGAKGSIIGLTLHTTPEEIYGAILEGVAMQFKYAMDIIESSLVKMDQITVAGGAVELRPHLAYLLAHVLERPLHYPLNKEVTCQGVGIYTMHLTGAISSLNDVIIDKRIIEPDARP